MPAQQMLSIDFQELSHVLLLTKNSLKLPSMITSGTENLSEFEKKLMNSSETKEFQVL